MLHEVQIHIYSRYCLELYLQITQNLSILYLHIIYPCNYFIGTRMTSIR